MINIENNTDNLNTIFSDCIIGSNNIRITNNDEVKPPVNVIGNDISIITKNGKTTITNCVVDNDISIITNNGKTTFSNCVIGSGNTFKKCSY